MNYIDNYIEIGTKNFCALYFSFSEKRHVDLDQLYDFYKHLSSRLRQKESGKSVNILYSSYYLSQVCYDYDNLFEMDDEQLSLKKNVSIKDIQDQLGYMSINTLVTCVEITKEYFDRDQYHSLPKHNENKKGFSDERTL